MEGGLFSKVSIILHTSGIILKQNYTGILSCNSRTRNDVCKLAMRRFHEEFQQCVEIR